MWRTASCAIAAGLAGACGGHLPGPPLAPPSAQHTFVDVTSPPPAAHVEYIPHRPREDAVWLDGQWTWDTEWRWELGGWLVPPAGAAFSPWFTVRRPDGALSLSPPEWVDAKGAPVAPPAWISRAEPAHAAQEQENPAEPERRAPAAPQNERCAP